MAQLKMHVYADTFEQKYLLVTGYVHPDGTKSKHPGIHRLTANKVELKALSEMKPHMFHERVHKNYPDSVGYFDSHHRYRKVCVVVDDVDSVCAATVLRIMDDIVRLKAMVPALGWFNNSLKGA